MAKEYNKKCYESEIMPSDVSHNCALWEYDQTNPYITAYFGRQVVYYAGPVVTYFIAYKLSVYLEPINARANFLGLGIASFSFKYIAPALAIKHNAFLKTNDLGYSVFGKDEIWNNVKILNGFLEYVFVEKSTPDKTEADSSNNACASGEIVIHSSDDE